MENYLGEAEVSIKLEPESNFPAILQADHTTKRRNQKIVSRKLQISLERFDEKWKKKAQWFEPYFVCENDCGYVVKEFQNINRHLKYFKKKNINCKRSYKCIVCDLEFSSSLKRKIHQTEKHLNGSNWQCSKCPYETIVKINFDRHCLKHNKKISCETCKKKFSINYHLKHHQMQHQHGIYANKPAIRHECEICDQSFPSMQGLRYHRMSSHNHIRYECDICGIKLKTKMTLYAHLQIHSKIHCQVCYKLIAKYHIKDHIQSHSSPVDFECKDCGKTFGGKFSLRQHMQQVHEFEKVQCDICNKTFKNIHSMRKHIQKHVKVPCSTCGKNFFKSNLKYHRKKFHSAGKSFLPCKIPNCQQKFKSIEELKNHENIHIGSRRYKCPTCKKEFKELHNIKKHLKAKHFIVD